MKWTTPTDLQAQVRKLWDRGLLLASVAGGESVFPRRLALKGPDSRALGERFSEVRDWIAGLVANEGLYRIEWRSVNHRVLGANRIPSAIWIDTLEQALGLIGKHRAAERFAGMVERTRETRAELISWLAKRPLRALALAEDWPQLLAIVDWSRAHPRPGVYLRQVDLAGVHTKLIETHRGVLAELFNLVLPGEAIDANHTGASGFCRRYGFLDKPARVRFRVLDPAIRLLPMASDQDITLTQADFASLAPPVATVFITENEINFLAFPEFRGAMVLFGGGYGFANLAAARWLQEKNILYWGDIDTHGFAILNQLRGFFPHTVSFLMDRETLLAHRQFWGVEPQPQSGDLLCLTTEEQTLYDELRQHSWGGFVRLEQEKIGFRFLTARLKALKAAGEQTTMRTDQIAGTHLETRS